MGMFGMKGVRRARFALGRMVATPGALAALAEVGVGSGELLERHAAGDWGEMDGEDAAEDELALAEGFRVMSVYRLECYVIWVVTEADRSLTTVLLPEEY